MWAWVAEGVQSVEMGLQDEREKAAWSVATVVFPLEAGGTSYPPHRSQRGTRRGAGA